MQKIKTILVVGASGATGRLLVEQLLIRGQNVKAIVRSPKSLPDPLIEAPRLSVIHASISELSDSEIAMHVDGCDAVADTLDCKGSSQVSFSGSGSANEDDVSRFFKKAAGIKILDMRFINLGPRKSERV